MKKLKQLLPILILMVSFIFSCYKSDDDAGNGGSAAEGTIVAKVDGTTITTLDMVTFANLVSGNLSIQGNTGGTNAKTFTLLIGGINGVGTYPIGGGSNIANSASYIELSGAITNPQTHTWQAPYDDQQAGEIKITELSDTRVKGTFHYKAKNVLGDQSVKHITEGSFNIKL
jgi:hypothetical protein